MLRVRFKPMIALLEQAKTYVPSTVRHWIRPDEELIVLISLTWGVGIPRLILRP
jgi:hypothetical protein